MYATKAGGVVHSRSVCRGSHLSKTNDWEGKRHCQFCPWPCLVCMSEDVVKGKNCHPLCRSCAKEYVQQLPLDPRWNGKDVPCPCGSGMSLQLDGVVLPPTVAATSNEVVVTPCVKPCVLEACLEEVSNLRCPHCRQTFGWFDGCCAVRCECKKFFCGLCLKPFDTDITCHRHVLVCPKNPGTDFFVTFAQWERIMDDRKRIGLWKAGHTMVRQGHGVLLASAMMVYVSEKTGISLVPRKLVLRVLGCGMLLHAATAAILLLLF